MARRQGKSTGPLTYKTSGVDISANDRMVEKIKHSLQRTFDPRVLSRHGGFAGCMRLDFAEKLLKRNYRSPVLVAGADGVGSKLLFGIEHDRVETLGIDLVAMSVNDVLCTGAEPLFFLDYVACHTLDPAQIAEIVEGISVGCEKAGCALLGGETAEMPALYQPDHFDLAGFFVGVAEERRLIDPSGVEPGDIVLGLASDGIHSNGFSLVHKALKRLPRKGRLPVDLGEPLIDAVLRPTRIYVRPVLELLRTYKRKRVVRAMAHITGGGIEGNLTRVLPDHCSVVVSRKSWPVPPIFQLLQAAGVERDEMFRVFNMGIGFVLIVRPAFALSVMRQLAKRGEQVYRIGVVRRGRGQLVWR